jgi:hypothetical protein
MTAGATYVPIATATIGTTTSSYTFNSISSAYTDLILVISGISTASIYNWGMQFNGDTATNYSRTILYGTGSGTAGSTRTTNQTNINTGFLTTNGSPNIINILNYSNTTTYKTTIQRGGDASDSTSLGAGIWRSTAAINSIKMYSDGGSYIASGTTLTLYGIAAA